MSSAPIYSLVHEQRSRAESAVWAQFSAPKDQAEFCASWLAILCSQIDRVSGALLVLGPDADGGYSAAAVWPDASRNMRYLGPTAERVLKEQRGLAIGAGPGADGVSAPKHDEPAQVAYPIAVGGSLHGAVVLDLQARPPAELQQALRLLHWASIWLVDQFRQQALASQTQVLKRMALATDLIATAVQERHFGAAALAVANELAARLNCERVSLGFERSGSIRVQAISHTAHFDAKTNLVRSIAEAMDEVLDLDLAVVHPSLQADAIGGMAHAELAAQNQCIGLCSVPLVDDSHTVGVITLERMSGEPFNAQELELCQTIGLLLGPVLALKRQQERALWQRLQADALAASQALFGPGHPGLKMLTVLGLGLLLTASLYTAPYRVVAKTVIEGAVQRAAVAPFAGYVAEGLVRAGDIVKQGQPLCRLVDRELKLEQVRWTAERELARQKYRQAAAAADRAAMMMAMAQIDQAQAQLSLVDEKLARATLVAPFDGIVVVGDLSQLQGSPVEQGKVLFEIAQLDAYRVILNIDERDIGDTQVGQSGELALSGLPYDTMRFAVKKITPVSTAQDGRNYFRVEAQIDRPSQRLRPGMEGIGKVEVGERKLIWIWTHGLVDWLRLWTWTWMP